MSSSTHPLAVYSQGQGQPLVLLHGLISTHRYWKQVADKLDTQQWQVITPDLLGFGNSPKPKDARYDLAQQVDHVHKAITQSYYNSPYVLVGHSMGAIVALKWAVEQPELFRTVILTGLPLFEPSTRYRQLSSGAESKQIKSELLAKALINLISWASLLPASVMKLQRTWPQHIAEDWTKQNHRAFKESLRNIVYSAEVLHLLRQLSVPTRLLVGKNDGMVGPAGLKQLQTAAKHNKKLKIEVLDSGHNIPIRYPEAVSREILLYNSR